MQGLDAERLQFLGRLHDVESGLSAVRDAIDSGMPRVSADFIFGVSGQTADAARREARILSEARDDALAERLRAHDREEPGTQFGALARQGKLPLLDEASVADSIFLAVEGRSRAGGLRALRDQQLRQAERALAPQPRLLARARLPGARLRRRWGTLGAGSAACYRGRPTRPRPSVTSRQARALRALELSA